MYYRMFSSRANVVILGQILASNRNPMKAAATAMKTSPAKKPAIRLAVVESDPLRFVGFRALFDSERDLELLSASLADLGQLPSIDLVLLGNRSGQNLFDIMASLKAVRPDLRIIVTGSGMDEESILKEIGRAH